MGDAKSYGHLKRKRRDERQTFLCITIIHVTERIVGKDMSDIDEEIGGQQI